MNFIRRDSYDRQNVMTIRLISIMIITDIKINTMLRDASRIELISIEIIHLREIRDTIDKVKRRIEDVLIIIYIRFIESFFFGRKWWLLLKNERRRSDRRVKDHLTTDLRRSVSEISSQIYSRNETIVITSIIYWWILIN